MTAKERFLEIYNEKITREGADKLLDFLLNGSDFFTAPASTRYHGAHEGGLVEHSLNDETGRWQSVPYYTIEDTLPYGHGEKSAYIVSAYIRLTRDEAFAIRYHMGFSGTEDPGNVGRALEMFPLAYATCCADMEAAFLLEGKLAGENK